jgi:hypothetical protein
MRKLSARREKITTLLALLSLLVVVRWYSGIFI